ncbi:MAG TPA: hypothetical protein VMP03_03530 [Methylomirabilota bacterium]|nr:hypothetical protein [Methylomirabilota bacterium]
MIFIAIPKLAVTPPPAVSGNPRAAANAAVHEGHGFATDARNDLAIGGEHAASRVALHPINADA